MKLDEAIKHARETYETRNDLCLECRQEHLQLYEWLEELKSLKELRAPKKPIAFKRTAHDFETGICPYSHYECEHIKPYNHEYEYTDHKCPACNKKLSDGTPDYCCHCGQALNWSDKE